MERTLLTLSVIATVLLMFALMRRGWVRAAAGEVAIVQPAGLSGAAVIAGPWSGKFLGTTYAQQWLKRIHVHGLGVQSQATVSITEDAINIEREGAPSFSVPRSAVRGVRADSGIAGRAYETGGIIVITYVLGELDVEFGVRFPSTETHIAALSALTALEVSP